MISRIVLAACFCAGAAWVVVLTSLYVSAQNVLPDWVRGRGLAIFLTVIFGAMTISSAAWGQIAGKIGLDGSPAFWRPSAFSSPSLSPGRGSCSRARPSTFRRRCTGDAPQAAEDDCERSRPRSGQDRILDRSQGSTRFLRAIDELGEERKRDGAFAWGVFEDMAEFGRFEEGYLIESWLELMHLARARHQRIPRCSRTKSGRC